ncbi:hypothetical protein SAMN06265347_11076 [Halobellus salinus]|nr:hypothetical protein SAMN06265347_11076 [Halobellus salinus]
MDSECPTASRTAGQLTSEFGANVTFTPMQSFKRGNAVPANVNLGESGRACGAASSGLRPCCRSADGDGR